MVKKYTILSALQTKKGNFRLNEEALIRNPIGRCLLMKCALIVCLIRFCDCIEGGREQVAAFSLYGRIHSEVQSCGEVFVRFLDFIFACTGFKIKLDGRSKQSQHLPC
ncbi:Hypothetical predicted protein [Olea europaea subsp. europaea]|uniref:Uncharacterized protein n=1 Tax=Olea europaea subsp. europaea TaxID=158383 RepID=A0A8S0TR18_OLEEU|nr:Hypothetical predicted protein [Olea europaea subsp. europaea]